MGFFDDIGKKITQTGQNIISKANEAADVSKLNSQISDTEKNIRAYMAQLGQVYYEKYGGVPHEGMEALCQSITDGRNRIEELNKQILAAKKIKTCPNCGAACDANLAFCGSCGTALPKDEPPAPAEETGMKYCSSCGKQIAADAAFCPFCGNKG